MFAVGIDMYCFLEKARTADRNKVICDDQMEDLLLDTRMIFERR